MFAALKFHGYGLAGYFNLSVDGDWVVQNVPVIAMRDGAPESTWFGFTHDGPSPHGGDSVGYSVSAHVSEAPPRETLRMAIGPHPFSFCGGDPGGDGQAKGPSADLTGGRIVGKPHFHEGEYPNQKSLVNQCVSVAFSNSLKWLKDTQGADPEGRPLAGRSRRDRRAQRGRVCQLRRGYRQKRRRLQEDDRHLHFQARQDRQHPRRHRRQVRRGTVRQHAQRAKVTRCPSPASPR